MTQTDIELAENQADLFIQEVKQISYELDLMDQELDDFTDDQKYYGKTVKQWTAYFSIELNMNATPVEVKDYAARLSERLNVAYKYKALTARKFAEFKIKYAKDKSDIVEKHASNRSRKTLPAAETLEKIAASELGIFTSLKIKYENALNFWQDIIYQLHSTLKLINVLAMSNGTLAKIEGHF